MWLGMGEEPTWQVLAGAGGILVTMVVESRRGVQVHSSNNVPYQPLNLEPGVFWEHTPPKIAESRPA